MTIEEIEKDIIEACEAFKRAGFALKANTFFSLDQYGECLLGGCALTAALVRGTKPDGRVEFSDLVENARRRYGWEGQQIGAFYHGFDLCDEHGEAHAGDQFYALGRRVRAVVLP